MEDQPGIRVLLVEDSEDNRVVYTTILEHFGCVVEIAKDGQQGIDLARRWLPDVILMDINLPKVSGWEATRILKGEAATAHIPIIALTALGSLADRETSRQCGCCTHLTKPCPPKMVLSEVRKACGRKAMAM